MQKSLAGFIALISCLLRCNLSKTRAISACIKIITWALGNEIKVKHSARPARN